MSFATNETGINRHGINGEPEFMFDSITKYIIHLEERAVEFTFSQKDRLQNSRHLLIDKKSNFCEDMDYDSLVKTIFSETNDLYFKNRKTKRVLMVKSFSIRVLTSPVCDLY
jgi:hypothetical protein